MNDIPNRIVKIAGLLLYGALFLHLMYGIVYVSPWLRVLEVRRQIPQAVEIFQQNREYFDILLNGEFLEENRWISRGAVEVAPANRRENLAELPDAEIDALTFLLTGSEPERNFVEIASDNGRLVARFRRAPATLQITCGGGEAMPQLFMPPHYASVHRRELDGGYILWVYANQPHGSNIWYLSVLATLFGIATIPVLLVLRRTLKARAKRRREEAGAEEA